MTLTLIGTSLAGLSLPGQWLRRVAAPLDFDELDLPRRRAIVRELLAAMHAPPGGVGLAATMAGLDLRLVIAEDAGRTLAMVNPEVVETSGPEVAIAEGNLCLPELRGEVVRPSALTVRWHDLDARPHEERFDGWLARILFHELELLDGRFFTDHVARTSLSGLGAAGQPPRVLTLPPELHGLRRTVLRQPAAPVASCGITPRALERLIDALRAAMAAAGTSSLTAPQIGVSLRLAVVATDDGPDAEPLTLIDATVVDRSQETSSAVERCASLPGASAAVTRPARIRLRTHGPDGEPRELDAAGPLARRLQHALDHLDGVMRVGGG
jgi:peptide deformylase